MPTRTSSRKTTTPTKQKGHNIDILRDLSLQLLTPEQFEAITKANYYHPESRLVLQLFLHVNYSWQIARRLQNNPSSASDIDWGSHEKNAAKLVSDSLSTLLQGIDREAWDPDANDVPQKPVRRKTTTAALGQACGCKVKHSSAAGVVAACQAGRAQGADETWTGY
jgi:hypothetical protein